MVFLTREEHFNAAHRLSIDEWSFEENKAVFGKCANHNFHGHNFLVKVTVKGEPDARTGFAMNVTDLSKIMKKHIIETFDHKIPNFPLSKGPQKPRLIDLERAIRLYRIVQTTQIRELLSHRENIRNTIFDYCQKI